ncbi:MAG: tetratricopeptide repeat protein [Terriglobales bacterium]
MKRFLIITVLVAASMAQAQNPIASPSSPGAKPGAAGQTAPAAQQAPGQGSTTGRAMPQAKTQDEFKAYQDAASKTTAADAEAAADAFAAKFPDSELRTLLYRKAMYDYQNANNGEKTIAMAKKLMAIDPNNPEALVTFATVTAQSTRETDLDRDERLNEAVADANKALQTIDTDLLTPPNAPPDRVDAYKKSVRAMAYDALGTVAMVKKDYPTAETNLRKSAELNAQPDPVTWLRLSVALDQQKKYPEALEAANKAVQYSADSPQANNLAKMERDRLQKLMSSGGAAAPAPSSNPPTAPTPTTPTPTTPPASKPPQR